MPENHKTPAAQGQQRKDIFRVGVYSSVGSESRYLQSKQYFLAGEIFDRGWGIIYSGADKNCQFGMLKQYQDRTAEGKHAYLEGHTTLEIAIPETKHGALPQLSYGKYHRDIETRIYEFWEENDAITIMAGGVGTDQELFNFMLLNFLSKNGKIDGEEKPIIIYDTKTSHYKPKDHFYEPVFRQLITYFNIKSNKEIHELNYDELKDIMSKEFGIEVKSKQTSLLESLERYATTWKANTGREVA